MVAQEEFCPRSASGQSAQSFASHFSHDRRATVSIETLHLRLGLTLLKEVRFHVQPLQASPYSRALFCPQLTVSIFALVKNKYSRLFISFFIEFLHSPLPTLSNIFLISEFQPQHKNNILVRPSVPEQAAEASGRV